MTQSVFDETLHAPPPGLEFGRLPPGQFRKGAFVSAALTHASIDLFLDISIGSIILKACSVMACGARLIPCCQLCDSAGPFAFLDFEPIPALSPKKQSFHSFMDAFMCTPNPVVEIDGYASLKIDLSAPIQGVQILGNQVTLSSLFAYSFQSRGPIAAPPDGSMNLLVWGPGGVGSDWLNGSGSLFAASVRPSGINTLTPNGFSPNVNLTGLGAFYIETALQTIESFPDKQDAYIDPETLRLIVSEILDVIVLTDTGLPISGAAVNIFSSTGTLVTNGTTDSLGVFTAPLSPGTYFAQSVLGTLSQTSRQLSPISQTVRFIWPVPRPSVRVSQIVGTTAFFDASASTDPASAPANDIFSWSFGDGTVQNGIGLEIVSHSYSPGTYNVVLTQTSPDSLSSTFAFTITISLAGFGGGVRRV